MKKNLLLAIMLVMVAVVGFAAGTQETEEVQETLVVSDLPDFVLNPPKAENAIYGVGYAKLARTDQSMSVAKSRARVDIARQIGVQIQSVMNDYFQVAGTSENAQTIEFVESVTREVTNQKLQNTVVEQQFQTPDGGFWVLMSFSKDATVAAFEESANNFVRNDEAAYSEFKAREAAAMLDSLLNTSPTTSEPVTE